MKTLEQITNFTPKERNGFIDEIIDLLDNYWDSISLIRAIKKLTDIEFNSEPFRLYFDKLRIDVDYISDNYFSKKQIISYLRSIKTEELETHLLVKEFVKKWMDGHEPDTFVKNEHGNVIYSAKHSSINLTCFFEDLLVDFIEENKAK